MIEVEVGSEGIAYVRFNRGERKNALSIAIIRELTRIAEDLRDRPDVHAIVLTGSPEAFSAGADQKDPERFDLQDKTLSEQRLILSLGGRMCKAWEDLPQITIIAVEGFNVGGGVALSVACDWRVMAEDAYLYVPEVQIGIPLGWNTIPRLVNLVGMPNAKKIVLLGEKMSAGEARDLGLADWVTPKGQAEAKAVEIARRVCRYAPHAVKMSKQSVNAYGNALNTVASYVDVDQALLSSKDPLVAEIRKRFTVNQ